MVATYLCRSLPRLQVMFILQFITPWRCFANCFVVGRSCFRAYCCSQVLCFNSLLCPDVLFSSILFRTFSNISRSFQCLSRCFGFQRSLSQAGVVPRLFCWLSQAFCFRLCCFFVLSKVSFLSCVYSCTSCGVAGNWPVMWLVVR